MTLRRSIPLRIILATVLALPVIMSPATALAAYTADAYEAGSGDDTPSAARDLTTSMDEAGSYGGYGEPMSAESHTFDMVNDTTMTSDEDWIKFTVSTTAVDAGYSYIIEAAAVDGVVDPVIELYGPAGSAANVLPTAVSLLGPDAAGMFTETDPVALIANDESRWFSIGGASLSFIPETAGEYYARIRPYYQYDGGDLPAGFNAGEGRYTLRVKNGQFSRLSGADRIDTAVAISRERFSAVQPFSGAVVLANGYGFADALAGSTLAGVLGCPVLLTASDKLAPSVSAEITRLGADTVYVLGGTSAVEPAVLAAVSGLGATPVRVAGADRIETAVAIANKAAELGATSQVAFVVSSRNFPDALAASPMAVYNGAPVLLTGPDTLDPRVADALVDPALGITDVVIVGGVSAVNNVVSTQISAALGSSANVRRIAGSTRYDTARDFAIWATGIQTDTPKVGTPASPRSLDTLEFSRIGVANGANFPDALAGGVFCGLAGSPILLTDSTKVSEYLIDWAGVLPAGQDYWFASDLAILRSYVFGGTSAVSYGVHLMLDTFSGPAF